MKKQKLVLIMLIVMFLGNELHAQKNRIGVNYFYTALDLPDDIVNNYQVNYQRSIAKRLFLFSDINFVNYKGFENTFNVLPETRKRLGIDLGLKLVLIKYKKLSLKLGGGLSSWTRNDELIKGIRFEISGADGKLNILDYNQVNLKSNNLGFNLSSDVEIAITEKIYAQGEMKFINVYQGGIISMLGLGLGVKF